MGGTILSGIISGIIASALFFIILQLVKPIIKVSKEINLKEKNGSIYEYHIKVVNKTLAMLTNVQYKLYFCKNIQNKLIDITEIKPKKPMISFIKKHNHSETAEYAVRLSYKIDVSKYKFKENGSTGYLLFTISGTHSITGATKTIERIYTSDKIAEGFFAIGDSLVINPKQ